MKAKGYSLAILSAFTYGMIPLFAIPIKQAGFSFDMALFYRFILSVILIGLFLLYKKVDFRVNAKECSILLLLGLAYSASSEFLFLGYDYMPAGVASTILFIYPVFVALIMGIGFKEKISRMVWIAITLAFLGVAVLNGGGTGHISVLGFFIVLLSALAYALYMVILNKSRLKEMNGVKVSFYSMLFCSFFFLSKAIMKGDLQLISSIEIGVNIILFSVITTVISLIALVYAIKAIGSTPTSVMGSMEPLVAVCISVILFHEPFTRNLAIGIGLIIIAVMLTILSDTRVKRKKRGVK